MRLNYYNIQRALKFPALSYCLALLFAGCGQTDDDMPGIPGESDDGISVSIVLAGAGSAPASRAAGEDSEDQGGAFGNADENYIDVDDLYVMTFSIPDGQTTLSDDSELLEVIWNGKNGGKPTDTSIFFNGTTAYLHTWLDPKITEYNHTEGKDFCLVAIANMSQFTKKSSGGINLTAGMPFSTLQKTLQYNFKPGKDGVWYPATTVKGVKKQRGIPVFGVKRVNLIGYDHKIHTVANPYLLTSNGNSTLWLLRAFSKVEIELSDALESNESLGEVTITSASIGKNYSSDFYLIPELSRMGDFDTTGGTGQVFKGPTLSIYPSTTATASPLAFTVSDDKTRAVVYLPEYNLVGDDIGREITLTLNIGSSTQTFSFDLRKYEDGTEGTSETDAKWQSLLRNHYYKFTVTVDLKIISVTPNDWGEAFDNEFNFGEISN